MFALYRDTVIWSSASSSRGSMAHVPAARKAA
jgi:hypothetical protein